LKILFLVTQDLDSPSCLGRFFPLARYLAQLGHEVNLVALHSDFSFSAENQFTRQGVAVSYVGQMHVRKRGDGKTYFSTPSLIFVFLKSTLALTRAALRTDADILYVCKPHPMNSLAALAARMLQRKTVFLDYDDYEAGIGRFQGAWQKAVIKFFENGIPRRVDHISTHTFFLRDRLLALGIPAQKITYLPGGVDVDRFQPVEPVQVEQLRKDLGLEGRKIVAFIGSLSLPSHPVEILLQAFDIVHAQVPESALLLVGGGDQYETLQIQAQSSGKTDHVYFAGRVSPAEIPAYYRLADVVVDPVHDDEIARGRLPLKMLESWISEVPFVSADVGDRKKLLGEPPAGLLARAGDASDLARCIQKVLMDNALADELRKRGVKQAGVFSWKNVTQEIISVMERYTQK